MDTKKKGDKLEKQVYDLFKNVIFEDRFYAKKELCKVFIQKGYYSKDREKDIIFDVAIEISLPDEDTYSHLILIECKNYNHRVPVGDVESFFAKAQQVSGGNIKAIVASTNSFQDGAFKFSKSKGIGLLRYYNPKELNWELTRSPSSVVTASHALNEWLTARNGLTNESYDSNFFDCYGYIDEEFTNSINILISRLLEINLDSKQAKSLSKVRNKIKKDSSIVKYIGKEEIESLCSKIRSDLNYKGGKVSLTKVCEWLTSEYDLKVIYDDKLDNKILGKVSFDPFIIYINDEESKNLGRKRFTLAHEIGHYLLRHNKYMSSEVCSESDIDLEKPAISIKDIMRMELQANYFASALLLPKENLIQKFITTLSKYKIPNKGHGHLYLDSQPCNLQSYYKVTTDIMQLFNVSRTVVKIRLLKLDLLREERNKVKRLNKIFQ